MSHARILSYPLRAAAPRRYLRFVKLIWRLGNVYLRFVRLSEHNTLGITALRLLESCGSRSASTLPSTPRNADSPLFSPLSAPIHLSVHDFQWAIGKGSSQTAPRTVFVLYDDNQLGRDIQGRGRFHSARLSCTNIHNPCPKVRKRSVLREHQRPRRAGEVEELYDTTDVSNPWWKYPVTGDENETDLFGGASAAYNRGALALAALRSTVGDAKFCKIEKTWVQEHQEQFDPTGLKINATYSDKSTKAIDAAERRVQPAVQDRRQHGSDHRPGGTRTADGRCRRGERHSEPEPQHRR